MKNNGIDKKDIYLYPDGIYLRENMKGYSYPKQVLSVDLSNVSALADYLEKGQPADEFRTVLDSENYTKYHKVPWNIMKKLITGAYYLFQTNNNIPGAVLFGFVFQKFSEKSQLVVKRDGNGNIEYELDNQGQPRLDNNGEKIPIKVLDNQDDFKIVFPHQTINNPGTSKQLMSSDADLQQYVNNDEYIYVGQFIFVNSDPNAEANRQIEFALHNMPQNIYVFNQITDTLNFAQNFGGIQILPTFNQVNNGAISRKVLNARQVYNYLSIPIDIKKTNGRVGINNDIDMSEFSTQPEYVYYDSPLNIQHLLNKASEEELNEFKQWSQNISLDNSISMDEALEQAQNNSIAPNSQPQQAPSDMVTGSSTPKQSTQQETVNENAPVNPSTTHEQTEKVNEALQGLSEEDLLGTPNNNSDSSNVEETNTQVEDTTSNLASALNDDDLLNGIQDSNLGGPTVTQNSDAPQSAQDIIDKTPADERFITNEDGNAVFYAQSHKTKPSAADRQREAFVDNDLSAQHQEMMSKAKNNPELGDAMKNLMNGRP